MSKQEIKILTDVEHVLLRPGMYVGSTKPELKDFWIPNLVENKFKKENLSYIPAQYKLFCEILDNCIDEHIRGFGNKIDVEYDLTTNWINIRDYGRGIPLDIHKDAKIPTPQVVYTQLRSGSNFNDSDRTTVGMNGVGAALATIFSKNIRIEIWRENKYYKQVISNNMSTIGKPEITKERTKETGTKVSLLLDDKIFEQPLEYSLVIKRCFELSYMFPKINFNLTLITKDGKKTYNFVGNSFETLVKMFSSEYQIIEEPKKNLRLAIFHNEITESFEQFSNVNGADTWRGGVHIDYFKDIFVEDLKTKIKKDTKMELQNSDILKWMGVVVLMTWNAPTFEGQTKEKLVNDKKDLSSYYDELFSSRRVTMITNGLPNLKQAIIDAANEKNERKLMQELRKKNKEIDRKRIAKLIDCSSKNRDECSIYITEGDSAISNLAMVRNSKTMAGLPLRGKVLNVFETDVKSVIDNKEIQSIMGSIGLKLGESPLVINDKGFVTKSNLNYGKIIIATDQDMDGYSIRCLLINFFFKFWPELFDHGYVYVLETPLYEVIDPKSKTSFYFYDKKEFDSWASGKNTSKYEISYFKGLGACGKEAWNYMINSNPNLVQIKTCEHKESKKYLQLAFGKDSDLRKEWLTT